MAAWSNEVVAIPIDSDAGISESFVTTVKRNVVIHFAFVIFRILLRACHSSFFVSGEHEDEIAFGFDLRGVEGANRREQRLDVARIVANARRIDATIANGCFDLQTGLKD